MTSSDSQLSQTFSLCYQRLSQPFANANANADADGPPSLITKPLSASAYQPDFAPRDLFHSSLRTLVTLYRLHTCHHSIRDRAIALASVPRAPTNDLTSQTFRRRGQLRRNNSSGGGPGSLAASKHPVLGRSTVYMASNGVVDL